jgi:hypothetical protein
MAVLALHHPAKRETAVGQSARGEPSGLVSGQVEDELDVRFPWFAISHARPPSSGVERR